MYRICCCSLAGTNACRTCTNNNNDWIPSYTYYLTYPYLYPCIYIPMKPHTKKTTEKYDKDGKLIERIIEEQPEEQPSKITWASDSTGVTNVE